MERLSKTTLQLLKQGKAQPSSDWRHVPESTLRRAAQ